MLTIPLRNLPSQVFDITLEGTAYKFRVKWNHRGQYYTLDISTKEDVIIIGGLKIALNARLLQRHPGIGLPPGEIIIVDSKGDTSVITQDNLEDRVAMVYLTEADIAAL
jgi:hypothetical protein